MKNPPERSNFPLPLSSVTGGARKAQAPAPVATPQTATRNAAHTAGQGGGSQPAAPRPVAQGPLAGPGARAAYAGPAAAQPRPAPYAPPGAQLRTSSHVPAAAQPRGAWRQPVVPAEAGTHAERPETGRPRWPAAAPAAAQPGPRAPGYAAPQVQPAPVAARSDLAATEAPRRAMAARVARQGVRDPQVLAALEAIPRHLFIEPALSAQAYIDASLPIGHNQTISQPYIVARMIEALREGATLERVLEIGTGCGYQAAVLSRVAREVYSIERIKPLHELAKANLRPLRISNLRLQYGDGMLGLPQAAPFDGIILAAAGLEVPQALLEQLAIGARLVAPVGAQVQHLQRITRTGKSEWTTETLEACHFVPLRPGLA